MDIHQFFFALQILIPLTRKKSVYNILFGGEWGISGASGCVQNHWCGDVFEYNCPCVCVCVCVWSPACGSGLCGGFAGACVAALRNGDGVVPCGSVADASAFLPYL